MGHRQRATSTDCSEGKPSYRSPHIVVLGAVGYLFIALGISYLVDGRGLLGLRERMLSMDMDHPALWFHLFGEGKVTEMLQWMALGATAILAAGAATTGTMNSNQPQAWLRFWWLIAVGSALMLIEDAGNVRHTIAAYPNDLFPHLAPYPRIFTAMAVMAAIAAFPLLALVLYRRAVVGRAQIVPGLIIGYLAYGIAAASSATMGLTGAYDSIGIFVADVLAGGELIVLEGRTAASLGSLITDTVIEESVELVGAAGLLSAAVAASLRGRDAARASGAWPET